jgi:Na+-transporting NADH:ubiquinone oxidoreductase subunit NqrD
MFLLTIVCSDPDCVEEREIAVDEIDAVDAYACDCGYGFVVVAVSEIREPARSGSLVSLPERRRAPSRKAA